LLYYDIMPRPIVAVIVPEQLGHPSHMRLGILDHAQAAGWNCVMLDGLWAARWRLADLPVAGVLFDNPDAAVQRFVRSLGCPAIALSHASRLPSVRLDDASIGTMAAAHLLDLGCRHLALIGYDIAWSRQRLIAAAALARQRGAAAHHWRRWIPGGFYPDLHRLGSWLASLPRPLGIVATHDRLGFAVLEACRDAQLHVPRDAAVIGVDDTRPDCTISLPPLTSVDSGARQLGRTAAALLSRAMAGERIPARTWVPAAGVIPRTSTSVLAIADREMAAAIQWIDANLHRSLGIDDLARDLAINRRSLERRFIAAIGRSPHQELRHRRIERARTLALTTGESLKSIARRCGLRDGIHLAREARSLLGITLTSLRTSAASAT
jgi:LacI family transcriptional regulator